MVKATGIDTVMKTLKHFRKGVIVISFIMTFSAGVLCGSIIMGLFVALVNFRDARDNW